MDLLSLKKDYPYDLTDGRENLEVAGGRVVRGGHFNSPRWYIRCVSRDWNDPDILDWRQGFRPVAAFVASEL